MKHIVAGLAFVVLLFVSSRGRAGEGRSGTTVVAGGFGASVGLMGGQLAQRLGPLPAAVALGFGFEGIAPQLQIDVYSFGNANLHIAGGAQYTPWEGLVMSKGSVIPFGTIGVQRWPYRLEHGGLFVNGEVGIYKLVRGHAEGGSVHHVGATVGGQIGLAF